MDRRLGLPREKATYICVRNHPELSRHATLSDFPLTVVTRDPVKGGNEGGKRAAVGKPGFFFFSFGIHFLSLLPQAMCVCLGRQKAAAAPSTRRFLITCIWPIGRKGPSRPHLCLRNGGL